MESQASFCSIQRTPLALSAAMNRRTKKCRVESREVSVWPTEAVLFQMTGTCVAPPLSCFDVAAKIGDKLRAAGLFFRHRAAVRGSRAPDIQAIAEFAASD